MNDNDQKVQLSNHGDEKGTNQTLDKQDSSESSINNLENNSIVSEMFAMEMGGHPLHRKMDKEHINKVLEIGEKHDKRQYDLLTKSQDYEHKYQSTTLHYTFFSFILILIFLALILYFFQDKPDILIPVLTGIGGLFTGAIGGYGFGKSSK